MNLLAVNFHYFRETTYPAGIYPTSRQALEQQIELLLQKYTFVSQAQMARWLQRRDFPEGNYCLLTFDDGLQEQMAAFDFLSQKDIPAIFYVPTNPIRQQKVLPVHQLHYVRTQLSDIDIFDFLKANTDIQQYVFDPQLLENQYRYDDTLSRKLKYYLNFVLPENEKQKLVQQLFDQLVADEAAFSRGLYMQEADLQRLATAGALGAHGSAHVPLATLPLEDARKDILSSIHYLESVGGKKVVSFSYPFGGDAAVSPALGPMLDQAGIQFAFTMKRGLNTAEQLQNPLFLHRVDTNDAPGGKKPLPELC